jgi:hypothetical protein
MDNSRRGGRQVEQPAGHRTQNIASDRGGLAATLCRRPKAVPKLLMTTARAGGVSSRWHAPRRPRLLPGHRALRSKPRSGVAALQQHGQGPRRKQGVGAARLACQRLEAAFAQGSLIRRHCPASTLPDRSAAHGGLCHEAPALPVTRLSRSSATRSIVFSGWLLPPQVIRAFRAHCQKLTSRHCTNKKPFVGKRTEDRQGQPDRERQGIG